MLKKSILSVVAVLAVLTFSTSAFAIVTTWDYSLSSVFTDNIFTDSTPDDNSFIDITPTKLTWGIPASLAGRSSLTINPHTVDDQVTTYTGSSPIPSNYWANSISVTHDNFPIHAPSLLGTTITTTVTLDPSTPNNPALLPVDFTYVIKFKETPNEGPYQNDVFALVSNLPNWDFQYDADLDGFGETYYVNIFPTDSGVLSFLPDAYAELAGVPHNTIGFTTEENLSTTLPFSFTISTEPFNVVPEPATFLLLGGGLVGLAFYRRKRK